MYGPDDSRRAFLAGGTVVAASAAFAADAKAESWTPLTFVQEKEKEDGETEE